MKAILRLLVIAAFMNGLLAGLNVQRALVDMPAWRVMGALGWAAFSRHADLGRNAPILIPLEAFSGTILSILVAWLVWRHAHVARSARISVVAAATLAAAGLLMTFRAAPFMLSLRHVGNDPALVQQAFEGFEFWGGVRGVFQVLAFGASLWSLAAVGVSRESDLRRSS